MKTSLFLFAALLLPAALSAQSLRFTAGSVSNTAVTLSLAGLTNTWCQVERLNRTNQVWDNVGSTLLGTNATATFNTSLHGGIYGFFRAKSTNGTYLSTNAFGAVAGTVGTGQTLVGNPFAPLTLTQIFRSPRNGTTVHLWRSGGYYDSSTYDAGAEAWDTNYSVGQLEGFFIENGSTNTEAYVVSGLFSTNVLSRSLVAGNNLLVSPLYKLTAPAIWKVDELNTNQLGGASLLPVQSPGFNPQAKISRAKDTVPNYDTFALTNGVWRLGNTNTVVPLGLVEGFWLYKPTNATWNVSLSIWP
jgi:hypothetical protein